MPLLTYSVSDFVAFTKIRSADVNSRFTDIKTLLNTTGLDDTNIQNAGITRSTKLKTGTAHAVVVNAANGTMSELTPGSAGTVLKSAGAGSALSFGTDSLFTQYDAVVGSAGQVTAGTANYSSIVTAIAALSAGDKMIILEGTYSESPTVSKQLYITGQGYGTIISGNVTFNSSSDFSEMKSLKITGTLTFDSGAEGISVTQVYVDSSSSVTDNNTSTVNYLELIEF